MNPIIRDTIKEYIDTNEEIKRLNKRLSELRNAIIDEHKKTKLSIINESGYISKLSKCMKRIPLVPVIVDDECYKLSPYDAISTEFDPTAHDEKNLIVKNNNEIAKMLNV